MRIAIIAPGSRGDVQPYIALGKGLKDQDMQQRAAELGWKIQAEDGIGRAAAVVEQIE